MCEKLQLANVSAKLALAGYWLFIFLDCKLVELELLTSLQTEVCGNCDLRPKAKTHQTVELSLTMLCSSNHGNRAEHSPEADWR